MVLLTAYMPIVAGMGGNAGTQALAVTVRGLAVGLIPRDKAFGSWRKEMSDRHDQRTRERCRRGGSCALALGHGVKLGMVVFLAMTVNLLVAGFAGAFVPILLERVGIDPAVASSIFVTTFTDVCGFSLLLGLAARFLI